MSARVVAWAWDQDLPATEKLTLVALAEQTLDSGVQLHAPQEELAAMTGASVRTVRSNLAKLEDKKLIRREAQFECGVRVASLIMLAVDGHLNLPEDLTPTGRSRRTQSSSSTSPSSSKGKEEDPARQDSPLAFEGDVPESMRTDANELLRRKSRVNGLLVSEKEMTIAAAVLAEFNRQLGSDFGLGAHLTPIVGRIRERPSYDAAAHIRLVQSAFRIKWWERGRHDPSRRTTPAVIYGNARCFENVVQDAADEKKGEMKEVEKRRGRFERKRSVEED